MRKGEVIIVCPQCGMETRIPSQCIGQKGRCKCCNKVFIASPSTIKQAPGPGPVVHRDEHKNNTGVTSVGKILVYTAVVFGTVLALIFLVFQIQAQYPSRNSNAEHPEQYSANTPRDTQRKRASQTTQSKTLTTEQRHVFDAALEQAGFAGYKSLALNKDGWVEVVYEVPPEVIAGQALAARMTLEEYLEQYASGAVRTIKDALPVTGMGNDTPCRVRLQGPDPEPGLIGAYGWATFTDQLSWKIQDL